MTISRHWDVFGLFFALFLTLCLAPPSLAQAEPTLARLEWRNVVLQEQAAAFEAALQLNKHRDAAGLAQKLIDRDLQPEAAEESGGSSSTWPVWNLIPDEHVDGLYHAPSYYFARRLTGALPETLSSYRAIFGQRADQAWQRAVAVGSTDDLQYIGRRFAATSAGFRALERDGLNKLASGYGLQAERILTDLIDLDWQSPEAVMNRRKANLAMAHMLRGELLAIRRLTETTTADSKIDVAGLTQSMHQLFDQLAQSMSVHARGPSMLAQEPGDAEGLEVEGKVALLWSFPVKERQGEGSPRLLAPTPIVSAGAGSRLILHDRDHVTAVDQETGKLLWRQSLAELQPESSLQEEDEFFDDFRGAASSEIYVALRGFKDVDSGEIQRELVAVSTQDGKRLWQKNDHELGANFPPLRFDCAPLAVDNTLYVTATAGQDDVTSYVLALELESGRLKWATQIGTGVSLPFRLPSGDMAHPKQWLGSLPLALVEGFLICCDNLGHIAALEPDSGRPRFLMSYTRRRSASSGGRSAQALPRGWDKNPILAHGDRFVVAPDDSDELLAFFVRPPSDPTRRRANLNFLAAATLPRQRFSQLLAFDGEDVILAGTKAMAEMSIICRTPVFISQRPREGWTFPTATNLLGRGYFGQKKVYFSTHKYVYGIDMESGMDSVPLIYRESNGRNLLGHVTLVPGGLIVTSKSAVQRYGKSD